MGAAATVYNITTEKNAIVMLTRITAISDIAISFG